MFGHGGGRPGRRLRGFDDSFCKQLHWACAIIWTYRIDRYHPTATILKCHFGTGPTEFDIVYFALTYCCIGKSYQDFLTAIEWWSF
jgi:hypothetical protein